MNELIEATLLIGQPDAGLFLAPGGSGTALFFGDAELVDDTTWSSLAPDQKAEYSRLDNHWVYLPHDVVARLAELDVRVSAKYECFYFDRQTLWERRFH